MENSNLIMDLSEVSALLSVAITISRTAANSVDIREMSDLCHGFRTLAEQAHEMIGNIEKSARDIRKSVNSAAQAFSKNIV